MSASAETASRMIPAFEINLLADRVNSLQRRRTFQQACALGGAALLVVGAVLAVLAVTHLTTAMKYKVGVKRIAADIAAQKKICDELEAMHGEIVRQLDVIAPLAPIARSRVVWTAKLAALAEALSPGMGITQLTAGSGDVVGGVEGGAQLSFSVITGATADPEGSAVRFVERLRKSPAFMDKMEYVRQEAAEGEHWNEQRVTALRISARGGGKPQ
jgi:hypothetical protein